MDSRHGTEFLIDFYAVLGTDRTADASEITRAYREKQKHYHPDRYEGLAPEFKNQAEERSKLLAEIYAILNDGEKKRAYDEQLAGWPGAISKNGNPVIDLTKPYFSPRETLTEEPDEAELARREKHALDFSGYDPNTFALVEQMYQASSDPSPEVRRAYQEQLEKRDIHLSLKEMFVWEGAGFHNQPSLDRIKLDYDKHAEVQIGEAGEKFRAAMNQTLLMISTGEIKLLGVQGEAITAEFVTDPSQALIAYQQRATERFTRVTERVRVIATERAELTEKRISAIKADYRPPQEKMFPFLAVCMETPKGQSWFCFYFNGKLVTAHPEINEDDLSKLNDPTVAQEWIQQERNIMYFTLQNTIEFFDQLHELVMRHFDPLVNPE